MFERVTVDEKGFHYEKPLKEFVSDLDQMLINRYDEIILNSLNEQAFLNLKMLVNAEDLKRRI